MQDSGLVSDDLLLAFLASLRAGGMGEEFLPGFADRVRAFAGAYPTASPENLTHAQLGAHIANESLAGASDKTVRNSRVAVEAFLAFLAEHGGEPCPAPVPSEPRPTATLSEPRRTVVPSEPAPTAVPSEPPFAAGLNRTPMVMPGEPPVALREVMRWPWSTDGVLSSVALIVPILCGFLPIVGSWLPLLYYPALVGYYFLTIDQVGRGRRGLPAFSDTEVHTLLPNAIRGAVCVLVMATPLIVAIVIEPDLIVQPERHGTALLGTITVGALMGPAVILSVYATGSTLTAFHPGAWMQIIRNFTSDYVSVALAFVLVVALVVVVQVASHVVMPQPGLLGDAARSFVLNLLWLSQACALGEFVRRNTHELGTAY